MNTRLHIGSKFQYQAGCFNTTYTAIVENIAIITNGKITEIKIYFSNDHGGQELYCMTPEEFHNQLQSVKAQQVA